MIQIKEGDYVRHKFGILSGGLQMPVLEVKGDNALCSFFYGDELQHKTDWVPLEELEIVHYGNGGFKNAGEL